MSLNAFVFSEGTATLQSVLTLSTVPFTFKSPLGLGLHKLGAFHRSNTTFGKTIPILCKYTFYFILSGFGGLGVACWPLVPKFAGSNPAEAVRFLGAKKSSARLPSEGK